VERVLASVFYLVIVECVANEARINILRMEEPTE
jgi:hypothetical protein